MVFCNSETAACIMNAVSLLMHGEHGSGVAGWGQRSQVGRFIADNGLWTEKWRSNRNRNGVEKKDSGCFCFFKLYFSAVLWVLLSVPYICMYFL